MTLLVPPPWVRFWFLAIGKRVASEYRPWVAQQLTDPAFLRRRIPASLVMPTLFVVVPQTLLALVEHSRWRLILPVGLLVFMAGAAFVNGSRVLPEASRRRLLAYHGVTADGRLVEPVSAWAANPLGTIGLALFCAQVLLFSSGVAVAADQITARGACQAVPAADIAALSAAVGVPAPAEAAAFGAPDPVVPTGARLVAVRQTRERTFGSRFAAAYVRDGSGRLLGPAVWRFDDPGQVPASTTTNAISAQDFLARKITPNLGFGGTSPIDPGPDAARACAKAAR